MICLLILVIPVFMIFKTEDILLKDFTVHTLRNLAVVFSFSGYCCKDYSFNIFILLSPHKNKKQKEKNQNFS